jgi:hypothetical protein
LTDYVRILCLFHGESPHFPGRLKPETEAAMKEALWFWVSADSRIANAGPDDLLLLLGTENHDLTQRPNYYLVTALLTDDPAYRDRTLADGHTARNTPPPTRRSSANGRAAGPERDSGSRSARTPIRNTPGRPCSTCTNSLPIPSSGNRFGLLLDLAFIEEAQISVKGRRGGGRSRGYYGAHGFESYKNLLYAPEGRPAGSSHSRVIETSRYQLPAEAVLLAKRAFPATEPFVIRNRVLGELETARSGQTRGATDWPPIPRWSTMPTARRPYLLGSTFQNPALTMPDPATGASILKYAGISRQNRTCGLLFDDPTARQISEVHPVAEHTGGGGRSTRSGACSMRTCSSSSASPGLAAAPSAPTTPANSASVSRAPICIRPRRRLDLRQQRQGLRRGEVPR